MTSEVKVVRQGMKKEAVEAELAQLEQGRDVALGKMLRLRVRYFSDGAVLGSRAFVDGVFTRCRDRFGAKRKEGARQLRGNCGAMARRRPGGCGACVTCAGRSVRDGCHELAKEPLASYPRAT